MNRSLKLQIVRRCWLAPCTAALIFAAGGSLAANGQADQGAITGTVLDSQDALIPGAVVILRDPATGLTQQQVTDSHGIYLFSPLRVGAYTVAIHAPKFETVEAIVTVTVNQRVGLNVHLHPGNASQTIEVSADQSLLQSEDASVSQQFSATTIEQTPLNGRNYVYIAQLTAGVVPPNAGARGANKGDFSANGQRVEQNNFILDGVDNNSNLVDFLNGASYVIKPPLDALQEFKVQTANYSAELGHSAGAVINASIKSGTNQIHGTLYEYFRNDILNDRDYFQRIKPEYRQNQFGATIGGPVFKNKLFFFADAEADRVIFSQTGTYTVPTQKMRAGDFSELLSPSLTGQNYKRILYQPNSGGTAPLNCNGLANVICPSQVNAIASKIVNAFPLPNRGAPGQTFNNYLFQGKASDNTTQYDLRVDWTARADDQAFARYSYYNQPVQFPPPLGILDGGGFASTGKVEDEGRNFVASETHVFGARLVNEARFGYNWLAAALNQENGGQNVGKDIFGLGGIPFSVGQGGLPNFSVGGVSAFGSSRYYHADERENVIQFLDNVTWTEGRHSLKFGVNLQRIRFQTLQPQQARGTFNVSGKFTQNPSNPSKTGFGVADLLLDQIDSTLINNIYETHNSRWYRALYAQDDFKVSPKLTFNAGVRYEYAQPLIEIGGRQANFIPDYPTSSGAYLIPRRAQATPIPASIIAAFQAQNITVRYTGNDSLVDSNLADFAPRLGFAYQPQDGTVVRGGFGVFYGGLESVGYGPSLGQNAPFAIISTFPSAGCKPANCPNNGQSLETGFSQAIAAGLNNFASTPALRGYQTNAKTPYSEEWNVAFEQRLPLAASFTLGYVGSTSRHLQLDPDPNQIGTLLPPGSNTQANRPFTHFGAGGRITFNSGFARYNGLQATLERKLAQGWYFQTSYTWSHALDAAFPPLGNAGDTFTSFRNWRQLGFAYDYGSSYQDVRQRLTLNTQYQLPFGHGRRYLSNGGMTQVLAGGWDASLLFRAQSGTPEIVFPSFDPTNGVGTAYAYRVGNPDSPGGVTNATISACPGRVHTVAAWFNPCAFNNPLPANGPNDLQAYGPRGRTTVTGPGFERIDMSFSKSFPTVREQALQFRADIFNFLNTPAYGQPGFTLGSGAGQITSSRFGGAGLAAETPDARVVQFALRYSF